MAKWYTGIQIDFAHPVANSQSNLYLRELAHKHWDTTDSKFKIQDEARKRHMTGYPQKYLKTRMRVTQSGTFEHQISTGSVPAGVMQ
jgi:hypothetical protein